ncbi:DUF1304 domain-containing protein [Staphylococcus casei]|uniref:DUF1304 domain-containing protein n=1 Tax=Staphylococcus TaxID=1279 RepID=UPI000CD2DA82|nr:DUF1304 domain-containing protein [Staphylococcus casei]PNZ59997.1 DUF1304 domain-containing protein [Staphylococcus casei]PTI75245.1 DUF1304 domain-containing protein [Staphylococcus succinus]WJE86268.1 DUF1304 domain-containing protein [Staphylococcus casei]
MSVISIILTVLVAIEFFFIMYLETIATGSKRTSKVFNISEEKLKDENVNVLLKNQGVYNGVIGLLLLYGVTFASHPKEMVALLLIYIIIVAIYGGLTSDKSIILKQGGLPIVTLLSLLI